MTLLVSCFTITFCSGKTLDEQIKYSCASLTCSCPIKPFPLTQVKVFSRGKFVVLEILKVLKTIICANMASNRGPNN